MSYHQWLWHQHITTLQMSTIFKRRPEDLCDSQQSSTTQTHHPKQQQAKTTSFSRVKQGLQMLQQCQNLLHLWDFLVNYF